MASSIYIHIPFCKNICSYCDFCKFIYNEKWAYAYLKALKNEINDRYMGEEIKTIYIGGGTPSALSIDEIKSLLNMLDTINKNYLEEFTFECNLEDINEELLLLLKSYRVNRLSIGIESFDKEKLKFMERNADFNDALEKITLCRNLGFDNINLDLMYAIPGETLKALKKDLSLFLKLNPNHISTYSLILESHTKAYVNGVSEIEEELDYEMYKYITEKLSNAHHYEISNFAIHGYESKHNLVYWNNEEYYGFGLGASGYIDKIRYTNTKNLKDYLLGNWVKEKEIIGEKEKMDYEIMLGLRKFDGINLENFKKKFGIELEKAYNIEPLLKSKELIKKKGNLYINPIYIYVSNEILLKII